MKKTGIILLMAAAIGLISCEKETMFEDGTYKAEEADYDHGWISFMEATISGDELTAVNWDARNADGDLKSETTADTYPMDPHPTVWIPQLIAQYMAVDITNYEGVDGITGATGSSTVADELFQLILDAAKEGDTSTQILSAE